MTILGVLVQRPLKEKIPLWASHCVSEPFLVTSLKDFSSTSALDKQLVRWRVLALFRMLLHSSFICRGKQTFCGKHPKMTKSSSGQ